MGKNQGGKVRDSLYELFHERILQHVYTKFNTLSKIFLVIIYKANDKKNAG